MIPYLETDYDPDRSGRYTQGIGGYNADPLQPKQGSWSIHSPSVVYTATILHPYCTLVWESNLSKITLYIPICVTR